MVFAKLYLKSRADASNVINSKNNLESAKMKQ